MNKEELEDLILNQGKTRKEIAEQYNCSLGKIDYYRKKFNIKSVEKKDILNKRFGKLLVLSKKNRWSYNCLCDCKKNICVNYYRLKNGIIDSCEQCKNLSKKNINKEIIYKLYIEENKNPVDIAKYLNISKTSFYRYLKEFNINKTRRKIIINTKIGNLFILKRFRNGIYQVKCDCGNIYNTRPSFIIAKDKRCKKCRINSKNEKYGIIPKYYWNTIINGAKSRGLSFNIDAKYAESLFTGYCALSGRKIDFYLLNKREQTASLDRIDSTKGYEVGNIQWLHKEINRLKNNYNQENFLSIIKEIYLYNSVLS